jgi:hypothetical protein
VFLFSSCDDEYCVTYYAINNSLDYSIIIEDYSEGVMVKSYTYESREQKEFYDSLSNGALKPPFNDSVIVRFNDSVSITHGSVLYEVEKNILTSDSYYGGRQNEDFYSFVYVFKGEDFEEAIQRR